MPIRIVLAEDHFLLREGLHSQLDALLQLSAVLQAISHKTADHSEAVNAFLEKRAPRYA